MALQTGCRPQTMKVKAFGEDFISQVLPECGFPLLFSIRTHYEVLIEDEIQADYWLLVTSHIPAIILTGHAFTTKVQINKVITCWMPPIL